MSFNGAGVFSINSAGNPVVTNTVISSTWLNALTADLATGLSTCLLKDGTQTATAVIPFAAGARTSNGSAAAPSWSFINSTDAGLYRIGANNIGFAIAGSKVWDIVAASLTLTQDLLFTDAAHDIGKTGATRPRDFFLSRNATIGGTLTYGGVTLTNAVTGTGAMVLATSPTLVTPVIGAATGTSLVLSSFLSVGTNPASAGAARFANNVNLAGRNAANNADVTMMKVNGTNQVDVAPDGAAIRWGTTVVALGGGSAPTLGTIGGSGPTNAAQNAWIPVILSSGIQGFMPVWI